MVKETKKKKLASTNNQIEHEDNLNENYSQYSGGKKFQTAIAGRRSVSNSRKNNGKTYKGLNESNDMDNTMRHDSQAQKDKNRQTSHSFSLYEGKPRNQSPNRIKVNKGSESKVNQTCVSGNKKIDAKRTVSTSNNNNNNTHSTSFNTLPGVYKNQDSTSNIYPYNDHVSSVNTNMKYHLPKSHIISKAKKQNPGVSNFSQNNGRSNSVSNLAKTLNLNFLETSLLYSISNKKPALEEFVEIGKSLIEQKKVAKIAGKSIFWEGSSHQLIDDSVKKQMNLMKDERAVHLLKEKIEKSHQRDMKVLEDKASNLKQERDSVRRGLQAKKTLKANLETILKDITTNNEGMMNENNLNSFELNRQIEKMEISLAAKKESRVRMERIIDLCKLNQIHDAEWLRNLELYKKNLNSCIKIQEKRNLEMGARMKELKEQLSQHSSDQHITKQKEDLIISKLSHVLEDFKLIKSKMLKTDQIVLAAVEARDYNTSDDLVLRSKEEERVESLRRLENKDGENEHLFGEVKRTHSMLASIFERGPSGEHWSEKRNFKETIDNIERVREIKLSTTDKEAQIEGNIQKIKTLEKKIKVGSLY